MSDIKLTEREREYLECETPLVSTGSAAARIAAGVFASLAQAVFSPGSNYGKADRGLMRTVKEIRYTKYKKAVMRKRDGAVTDKDIKTLEKLNKNEFILAQETFDNDEFTRKVYEEYMKKHGDKSNEE